MGYIFVISSLCVLFFGILLAFPRTFLAKLNYKDITHPDDIKPSEIKGVYVILSILFTISLGLVFYSGYFLG